MMTANWPEVVAIFDAVVDLSEHDRKAYLFNACRGDESLKKDVEAMLAADAEASGFLTGPLFGRRLPLGAEFEPSERVGPYEIVRLIGRGGMGAVYLAHRVQDFQRTVAIKVIDRLVPDRATLRRFLRERQILSTLDHPNIARLYDGGVTESGMPYLVMEFVEGVPIDEYCERASLSLTERLNLFRDVCLAVAHAHRHLIVHRDLKPGNILVTENHIAKLLDFGIAHRIDRNSSVLHDPTSSSVVAFTPNYGSPEQVIGGQVTTSSDVFTLGVILSRLIPELAAHKGGSLPITSRLSRGVGSTSDNTAWWKLSRANMILSDLAHVIHRATSQSPEDRHSSAGELENDLSDILHGNRPQGIRGSLLDRGRYFLFRNRNSVVATGLVASILISSIWMGLSERRRASEMNAVATSLTGYLSQIIAISDPEERVDSLITARQFLDVGIQHARTWLGPDSDPYHKVASQFGRLYIKIGEAGLAEEVFRELLDHTVAGSNQVESLLGYGMALQELGKHDLASHYYGLAYQNALDDGGGSAYLIPEILEQMVLLSIDLEELPRADSLTDICLGLGMDDGPSTSLRLADFLILKAEIMMRYDSLDLAEQLYGQALQIQQRELGANSLKSAVTMNNLGIIYTKTGRPGLAEQILSRALEIKRDRFGSAHPSVGTTLLNLAEAKRYTAGLDSAVATLRSALAVFSQKLSQSSPRLAQAKNNLAVLLEENGDQVEAERFYREAVVTWEASLPSNHPTLIKGWHNLAMLLRDVGRGREAAGYYSKVVFGYRSHGVGYRKQLAEALMGQAKVQRSLGDLFGAEASFRESLSIREQVFPPGHWRIGTARSLLGETLGQLGHREEAEEMLRSGLEIIRSARGPTDAKTMEAEQRLRNLDADIKAVEMVATSL